MNLAFHVPKKDVCNICDSYRQGDEAKKASLLSTYETHILEKQTVRNIKDDIKRRTEDPFEILATFDLEQVIYLPKTNRCEVFYRRRLANYHFTIFNVKTKQCNGYL